MSAVFEKALELSLKGEYIEAIMFLRREGDTRNPKTWILIGRSYCHVEGEAFQAIKAFQEAKRLNPQCIAAYTFLARTYENLGKPMRAEEIIDEGLRENPGSAELWEAKASCCMNRSNFIEAFQIAENLEQEDTVAACKIRARANGIYAQEDNDLQILREALANWDAAINLNPEDFESWMGKAEILSFMGNYNGAIKAVNHVLKLVPGYKVAKEMKEELIHERKQNARFLRFIPKL